jgi:hypothetical protein
MISSIGSFIPVEKVKMGMRPNIGSIKMNLRIWKLGKYYEKSTFDSFLLILPVGIILSTI